MIIHEILVDRRKTALDQIAVLEQEITEIDRMLTLSPPPPPATAITSIPLSRRSKEEQVIEAVKAGCHTPAQITEYLAKAIGKPINAGSIRTRLTRMKGEGKIRHEGKAWCLVVGDEPKPE